MHSLRNGDRDTAPTTSTGSTSTPAPTRCGHNQSAGSYRWSHRRWHTSRTTAAPATYTSPGSGSASPLTKPGEPGRGHHYSHYPGTPPGYKHASQPTLPLLWDEAMRRL